MDKLYTIKYGGIIMNNFFSNRQISFIMYCIIVGYGIINLPKNAAEAAGTSGWICIALAIIIFIFITYIITYLQYVYEGKTLYEYSIQLVGKNITYIFISICIIYFFIFLTMLVRLYCETINMTILNKTPVMYLCILFYIVVFYALMKGINVIARMCEIYGALSIINFILINSILLTQGKIVHVRPFFYSGDYMMYLKGALKMVLPLLGMEVLFFIPFNRKKNKNIFKYTTLMVIFIGFLYIFVVEATLSVVGVDSIMNHKATVFSIIRGIDVPYLEFFRRLDGVYIGIWSMNAICASSLWAYGTTTFMSKILKNMKYKYISVIVIISSFIVSQIPKTTEQVENIINYDSYFGIMVFLVIPIILLVITKVKKYDKKI